MNRFGEFSERKVRAAGSAVLTRFTTLVDRSPGLDLIGIGNPWTQDLYDGPFYLRSDPRESAASAASAETGTAAVPLISLVFVQSRDGNTGADNPEDFGGGPLDKHLIYEGLSRVGADAVLAGARSTEGPDVFYSVWHPELVALRSTLNLSRHPAQVVLSRDGSVDLERGLLFNVPQVPVFILASPAGCDRLERAASGRTWIQLVPVKGDNVRPALEYLRSQHGIRRISAIGGRTIASGLIDAGLVQDLVLTTTTRPGGEPETPYYVGRTPPRLELIVRKGSADPDYPIRTEQSLITNH